VGSVTPSPQLRPQSRGELKFRSAIFKITRWWAISYLGPQCRLDGYTGWVITGDALDRNGLPEQLNQTVLPKTERGVL
jgi:hypothetical protein